MKRMDHGRNTCYRFHTCYRVPLFLALLLVLPLGVLLAQSSTGSRPESQKPLELKADPPGMLRNHRLILKDGSYQLVRQYSLAGDRVRYLSVERGDWEEIPADLIDWDATRKWERDHATPTGEGASPAMKEAEDIDKEEADERELQKARMPEVMPGLELPDQDGVFALDNFQGTPELVELTPNDLDVNAKSKRGVAALNPLAGSKANLELTGQHSKVHLHVDDPTLFVSLNVVDDKEPVLSHAMTVGTRNEKEVTGKHGAHSDKSGFAIVRVDERQAVRIVGAIHVSPSGTVTQDENVIPTKVDVMPGNHWLRLHPEQKLAIGEYALVEILSPSEISPSVWDFRVNPATPDNPGSLGPILKNTSQR